MKKLRVKLARWSIAMCFFATLACRQGGEGSVSARDSAGGDQQEVKEKARVIASSNIFADVEYDAGGPIRLPWSRIAELGNDLPTLFSFLEELKVAYGEQSEIYGDVASRTISMTSKLIEPSETKEIIDSELKGDWKNKCYELIIGVLSENGDRLESFANIMPFNKVRENAFEQLYRGKVMNGENVNDIYQEVCSISEPEDRKGALLGFRTSLDQAHKSGQISHEEAEALKEKAKLSEASIN